MTRAMDTTLVTRTTNTNAFAALTAEISKYPTMSIEEEIEKFEEYAKADGVRKQELKREIATANLRFVLSVAKKYSTNGNTVAELVSIGTFGLYRAIDSFDLSLGFKFISHAVHWIRAEISDYYRNNGSIVRRTNNAKIGSKDKAIINRFIQTEYREPTEDELIEALEAEHGIKVRNRVDVLEVKTIFSDEKVGDGDGDTLGEVGEIATVTASRNEFERKAEKEDTEYRVRRLLNGLSVREQEVVTRKFGIGYDREYEISEIAEAIGCSGERCRQILTSALNKIRNKKNKGNKLAL